MEPSKRNNTLIGQRDYRCKIAHSIRFHIMIDTKEYTPTATASQVAEILPVITAYASGAIAYEKSTVSVLDQCRANKIPPTHFISPNRGARKHLSTVTSTQFNQFKLAMLKGYPEAEQKLVMTSAQLAKATELNDTVQRKHAKGSPKAKRKTMILADIGSKIGKIGKMLEKNPTDESKEAANKSKGKRAPQQGANKIELDATPAKVRESLQQAIKRAQACEFKEGDKKAFDVVKVVALIEAIEAMLVTH